MKLATRDYFTLHYSILPDRQTPPLAVPLPEPDGLVVCSALLADLPGREFAHNGGTYRFQGFHFVEPTDSHPFDRNRYLIGEIQSDAPMAEANPVTIVDTFAHEIFIQKKGMFSRFSEAKEALQAGLSRPIHATYNCNILLE